MKEIYNPVFSPRNASGSKVFAIALPAALYIESAIRFPPEESPGQNHQVVTPGPTAGQRPLLSDHVLREIEVLRNKRSNRLPPKSSGPLYREVLLDPDWLLPTNAYLHRPIKFRQPSNGYQVAVSMDFQNLIVRIANGNQSPAARMNPQFFGLNRSKIE